MSLCWCSRECAGVFWWSGIHARLLSFARTSWDACVCILHAYVFCASAVTSLLCFPHTLWLAPLTAFGNVCLLSLASLHLEHAPGKLPDPCAIRLVVISCSSALLGPMRVVQLSVLCHGEARAVISALDSPAITVVCCPNCHRGLMKKTIKVFLSVIYYIMSSWAHMDVPVQFSGSSGLVNC